MRLLVDCGLLNGRARTLLLQFHDEFGLFVLAKQFMENFVWSAFLRHNPKRCVFNLKPVALPRVLHKLLVILEDDADRLPSAETVVGGVGHHDQPLKDIHLVVHVFKREVNFSVDLSFVHKLFCLHTLFKHLLAELLAHEPPRPVVRIIDHFAAPCFWRHLLESINDRQILMLHIVVKIIQASERFRLLRTFRRELFDSLGGPVDLESHVVDCDQVFS